MFSDTDAASRAARTSALAIEQPELGTLLVSGRDRRSWLNGLLTCDVEELALGRGAWGLALTKQGKIMSEVQLVERGSVIYVAVSGAVAALASTLDGFLIMEDAELQERSADFGWLMLHGPRASEIAESLATRVAAHGAVDWTGLGGAALVAARSEVPALLRAVEEAGAVLGVSDDWLRLRIERGVPAFGVDYDSRDNPHQAALDRRAVSWTKGCYLGQEVVCMQDMRGKVKRRILPLIVDGDELPHAGAAVESEAGEHLGEVTSSTHSPALGRAVILARLKVTEDVGCGLRVGGRPAEIAAPI
jgi:folate-binding protein YgfZ